MLTDTEANALNTSVALAMGWKLTGEYSKINPALQIVTRPDGFSMFGLPDFCRDAHALGWIVDWADSQEGVGLSTRRVNASLWGCTIRQGDIRAVEVGGSRSEAVVRAIVDYACQQSDQKSEASAEGQKEGAE